MVELDPNRVYVGEVVRLLDYKTSTIRRNNSDGICSLTKPGNYFVDGAKVCRCILFMSGDKPGFARDLLYGPSDRYQDGYPILNYADYHTYGPHEPGKILIHKTWDLVPVLEYFGNSVPSTPEEAWIIRRTFFDGSFPYDNSDAFGYPMRPPTAPFGLDAFLIPTLDPSQFYGCQAYRNLRTASANKEPLPSYYFDVLRDFGDRAFFPAMFDYNWRMNAFKPHRREGPVKALKR